MRSVSRLFVALVFLGVGSLQSLALCIGPEHWDIELAGAACCRPTSANQTTMLGRDGGSCAGDCVDTPLGVGVATSVRDYVHQMAPAQAAVVASSMNVPLPRPGCGQIRSRAPRPSELSPRYLRTTVNLC